MRVLIADDAAVCRKLLTHCIRQWGHDPVLATDGTEALSLLQRPDPPAVAFLDWMMPGPKGPEICAELSLSRLQVPRHLILVTSRTEPEHIAAGLEAGADDYVGKPFEPNELRARLDAGIRAIQLQRRFLERIRGLEASLAHLGSKDGFLPICCYCSNIRDERGRWERADAYFHRHAGLDFSHGICPDCFGKVDSFARKAG